MVKSPRSSQKTADDRHEDSLVDALKLYGDQKIPRQVLARRMVENALLPTERARILAGGSVSLILICPDSTALKPIADALSYMCRGKTQVCLETASGLSSNSLRGFSLPEVLSAGGGAVLVVQSAEQVPETMKIAAERTIQIAPPSASIVAQTIASCSQGRLSNAFANIDFSRLSFELLAVAIPYGGSVKDCITRITRALDLRDGKLAKNRDLPDLEAAYEFGDARYWALDLQRDVADLKAGRITWSELDRGAVIYGPPGSGKTTFVKVVAEACGIPLISGSVADLFTDGSGHLGPVLKAQKKLFDQAQQAAASGPVLLFIDELSAMPNPNQLARDSSDFWLPVINDFYMRLDSARSARDGVIVVGATNGSPHDIDPALLRPGRLERSIYLGPVDAKGADRVLRHHLSDDCADIDISELATLASGRTAAVIMGWVRGARRSARRQNRPVELEDIRCQITQASSQASANLYRIAVHEDGHAVIGATTPSLKIETVSIIPASDDLGSVSFDRVGGTIGIAEIEDEVVFRLAGSAAEKVILGSSTMGFGGAMDSDLALATGLLTSICTSYGLTEPITCWRGPPAEMVRFLQLDPELRRQVDKKLQELMIKAKALIDQNKDAVERIAAELLVRLKLSGLEIEKLVEGSTSKFVEA